MRNIMFYAVLKNDGEVSGNFYDNYDEWHRDTFCPDTEVLCIIDLHTHGKDYAARKADLVDKAHDFESLFSDYGIDLSYGELAIFQDFFTTYGKRYGLLTEFRENGIC